MGFPPRNTWNWAYLPHLFSTTSIPPLASIFPRTAVVCPLFDGSEYRSIKGWEICGFGCNNRRLVRVQPHVLGVLTARHGPGAIEWVCTCTEHCPSSRLTSVRPFIFAALLCARRHALNAPRTIIVHRPLMIVQV